MSKKTKIILYGILLSICLTVFILQIFIFESPDGNLGLLLCMTCTGCITYSTVRLYQLSKSFQSCLKTVIDVMSTISGFKIF